jgi:hypothetical protein
VINRRIIVLSRTAVLKNNRLVWLVTVCVPVLVVIGLASMPPITECTSGPPANTKDQIFQAHRVVVEPWQGPHHVYGIFSLPAQYRRHHLHTARLIILGVAEDLPAISPESELMDGSKAQVDHDLVRVHFQTRRALWILLTGRFRNLKSACHWWLVVSDPIE